MEEYLGKFKYLIGTKMVLWRIFPKQNENICPVLIDSFSSTNLSHLTFPTFKILSFLNVFNRHEICITWRFLTYMNLSYLHVSSTASITSQAGTSLAIFTFLWTNTIIKFKYKSLLVMIRISLYFILFEIYTKNTVFRTLKKPQKGIFRLLFSFY